MTINHNNITVTITEAETIKRIIDAIFPTENKGKEYVKKEWGSTPSTTVKRNPQRGKPKRHITPEEWQSIIDLRTQRIPVKVIAKRLGRTVQSIQAAWGKHCKKQRDLAAAQTGASYTVGTIGSELDKLLY